MKQGLALALVLTLALSLTACSGNQTGSQPESSGSGQTSEVITPSSQTEEPEAPSETPSSEVSSEEADGEAAGSSMLIAYFSYAENAVLPDGVDASATASIQTWNNELTGNTGVVAHMIAEATGADLFSIQTVEKYPDTYDATIDQGREEQNADARPELAALPENLESYDVIFLGYPNWWGDMPMAIYSFLEQVDLSGKTIVPFVTSGGSGFSSSIGIIENMQSGATVQEGLSIGDSSATSAQDQVNEWLSGLGYVE